MLAEADRCTKPGEVGALLRREGLYSSLLSAWRRQRDAGELSAHSPKKRGPRSSDALMIATIDTKKDASEAPLGPKRSTAAG